MRIDNPGSPTNPACIVNILVHLLWAKRTPRTLKGDQLRRSQFPRFNRVIIDAQTFPTKSVTEIRFEEGYFNAHDVRVRGFSQHDQGRPRPGARAVGFILDQRAFFNEVANDTEIVACSVRSDPTPEREI
jgi:hypothetical protein